MARDVNYFRLLSNYFFETLEVDGFFTDFEFLVRALQDLHQAFEFDLSAQTLAAGRHILKLLKLFIKHLVS